MKYCFSTGKVNLQCVQYASESLGNRILLLRAEQWANSGATRECVQCNFVSVLLNMAVPGSWRVRLLKVDRIARFD